MVMLASQMYVRVAMVLLPLVSHAHLMVLTSVEVALLDISRMRAKSVKPTFAHATMEWPLLALTVQPMAWKPAKIAMLDLVSLKGHVRPTFAPAKAELQSLVLLVFITEQQSVSHAMRSTTH
jgi:hypothetical protein